MGRLVRDDRKATITQIITCYNQGMQNTISEHTACRTLKQMGYSSRGPHQVPVYVFRFYGLPEDVVSDRGPQLTSRVWTAFCQKLNINVSLPSIYHRQSNRQVERLNQELPQFFRSYCH